MHNAVVNPGAKIGKNCIINTGSIIEHDVIIEDHCHVAPGNIVNGGTLILIYWDAFPFFHLLKDKKNEK